MSLNTLKRKSETKYFDKVSKNKTFSLTGTQRLQGFVGQTNLSRSVKRTPFTRFKGPRGHGSKYGIYPVVVHNSGQCIKIKNDDSIKNSTINTKGFISQKFKWAKRGYPFSVVQPDSNSSLFDSSSVYTHNIAAANTCVAPKDVSDVQVNCSANIGCSKYIGGRRILRTMYSQQFSSSVPQSLYLLSKTKRCADTAMGKTEDSAVPAKVNNDGSGCAAA
jgi:hypothetical protein